MTQRWLFDAVYLLEAVYFLEAVYLSRTFEGFWKLCPAAPTSVAFRLMLWRRWHGKVHKASSVPSLWLQQVGSVHTGRYVASLGYTIWVPTPRVTGSPLLA
mmetsp:Transcript_23786/g.70611  ORF Transcript_23786/g.70611 Transcript_23786/m.70611 type:complete len:101 (-) Transcript_23786:416-718(-)